VGYATDCEGAEGVVLAFSAKTPSSLCQLNGYVLSLRCTQYNS